ncbi:response regulator transcription factor [Clostridium estertheticum]|uniref:Stage 0 sporulation protein A homolog n=2 Tax=Clostridium estertheticum TaxID=238834 RepID=A0A1J0GCL3_9CLOT|nr:response regulator transcription factor [Clostridium estertheticum]APC39027.1 DNA-binding response regulator [Clostridium estertheticum subsp. estertheticum]MBU3074922.1 response regulator transcription factor [Clostridium estertheticum]MBU3165137.1 response regulator transcription factor [Clostridium estertheticum]MBU3173753.1 response regulator transcription factor [Clostridium estertheticum]MBU3183563.1 response regulator transcription factor [Clostridium estertheticum]
MKDFRILLVEDERLMSTFIEMELSHEGYKVDVAYDGQEGLTISEENEYNLILLDVMLPGLNGIEVCRRIRQVSIVPVIMLTAKSDISDKVLGLDVGANDYLTKPFAIEELLARIRVYQRDTSIGNKSDEIKVKDIVMDNKAHNVKRGSKEIELTKKEFDLLETLLINKNVVLTRVQLIEKVWGYDYIGDTNVVDVFIRYLRCKIDDGFEDKLITTVRGVGYVVKGE